MSMRSDLSRFNDASGRFAKVAGPPPQLYPRVRAALAETRASGMSTQRRAVAALGAIAAWDAAIVWLASEVVYHRPLPGLDLAVVSTAHANVVLGLLIGLTWVVTTAALQRGHSGLGTNVRWLAVVATLTAPTYAAVTTLLPVHAGAAGGLLVAGVAISPWGFRCALIATLIGGVTLTAFVLALRRAVATARAVHGAALGAAAGAWAGFGVFVFCPSGSVQHMLVGHASVIVLLTLAAALSAPRWLRV